MIEVIEMIAGSMCCKFAKFKPTFLNSPNVTNNGYFLGGIRQKA